MRQNDEMAAARCHGNPDEKVESTTDLLLWIPVCKLIVFIINCSLMLFICFVFHPVCAPLVIELLTTMFTYSLLILN